MSANQKRHPNQQKWIAGPSWEQIERVVKAFGVGIQQFQRFHNMTRCIRPNDKRPIPARYWDTFLRIPETFGRR